MLLMQLWTDTASLCFNVKAINLVRLNSKNLMWNFRSSTNHDPPFVRPWQLAPRPCNDDLSLLSFRWGETKELPLQRVKFSFHHNSYFLASTEVVTFSSKELWQVTFWICWCWKWWWWRVAGRTAIAVDDNNLISFSSRTVDFSFSRISWQWLCTLRSCIEGLSTGIKHTSWIWLTGGLQSVHPSVIHCIRSFRFTTGQCLTSFFFTRNSELRNWSPLRSETTIVTFINMPWTS